MNYVFWIILSVILIIVGIILAVSALIWHRNSSIFPTWSTNMSVLLFLGCFIIFIGLLILVSIGIIWIATSPTKVKTKEIPPIPRSYINKPLPLLPIENVEEIVVEPEMPLVPKSYVNKPLPSLPPIEGVERVELEQPVLENVEIEPAFVPPPPPPRNILSQRIYDPLTDKNLTIGQLRRNCSLMSLDKLALGQQYQVYQDYCFDILRYRFDQPVGLYDIDLGK